MCGNLIICHGLFLLSFNRFKQIMRIRNIKNQLICSKQLSEIGFFT